MNRRQSARSASRALGRDPVPGIDPDSYPASLALLRTERACRCVPNEAADVSNAEPTTSRGSRANVRYSFLSRERSHRKGTAIFVEKPPQGTALEASLNEALTGRRAQGPTFSTSLQFGTAASLLLSAADSLDRAASRCRVLQRPFALEVPGMGSRTWDIACANIRIFVNSCCHFIFDDGWRLPPNHKPGIRWKPARGALQGVHLVIPQAWNRRACGRTRRYPGAGLSIGAELRRQAAATLRICTAREGRDERGEVVASASCVAVLRAAVARTSTPAPVRIDRKVVPQNVYGTTFGLDTGARYEKLFHGTSTGQLSG